MSGTAEVTRSVIYVTIVKVKLTASNVAFRDHLKQSAFQVNVHLKRLDLHFSRATKDQARCSPNSTTV